MLGLQILGLPLQLGEHLFFNDALRHLPIGAKNHRRHVCREDRSMGRAECPADDHVHLQQVRLAILQGIEGEQAKLRNVDDDRRSGEFRHPAPALQGQLDLPHPRRKRHRESPRRGGIEDTVHSQAVACLKSSRTSIWRSAGACG